MKKQIKIITMLCLVGSIANIKAVKNISKKKTLEAKHGKKSPIVKKIKSKDQFGKISWLSKTKIITNTPKKVQIFSLNGKDITPKGFNKLHKLKGNQIQYCIPSPKGDKIAIINYSDSYGPYANFYNKNTFDFLIYDGLSVLWHPDNESFLVTEGREKFFAYKYPKNTIKKNSKHIIDERYKKISENRYFKGIFKRISGLEKFKKFSKNAKYLLAINPHLSFNPKKMFSDSAAIIEAETGKVIIYREADAERPGLGHGTKITFIDNKSIAYKIFQKPYLIIRDFKNNKRLKTIKLNNCVTCIDVSSDGKYIAAAYGKKIDIIDVKSGNILHTLIGHTGAGQILQVKFSKNGEYIASRTFNIEQAKQKIEQTKQNRNADVGSEIIIWENPAYKKSLRQKDFENRINYILDI